MVMMLKRAISSWIQRNLCCPIGRHQDKLTNGEPANFCGGCGLLLKPEAFKEYSVTLRGGDIHNVMAINPYHARSLVVYGPRLSMDEKGNPLGEVFIHPENITSIILNRLDCPENHSPQS